MQTKKYIPSDDDVSYRVLVKIETALPDGTVDTEFVAYGPYRKVGPSKARRTLEEESWARQLAAARDVLYSPGHYGGYPSRIEWAEKMLHQVRTFTIQKTEPKWDDLNV
jgi:hypothetical protein